MDDAPSPTAEPLQMELALPTVTDGVGLTVIFTESDLEQPVAVIFSVNVYVVVVEGDTDGLALLELNPEGLLVQL